MRDLRDALDAVRHEDIMTPEQDTMVADALVQVKANWEAAGKPPLGEPKYGNGLVRIAKKGGHRSKSKKTVKAKAKDTPTAESEPESLEANKFNTMASDSEMVDEDTSDTDEGEKMYEEYLAIEEK